MPGLGLLDGGESAEVPLEDFSFRTALTVLNRPALCCMQPSKFHKFSSRCLFGTVRQENRLSLAFPFCKQLIRPNLGILKWLLFELIIAKVLWQPLE